MRGVGSWEFGGVWWRARLKAAKSPGPWPCTPPTSQLQSRFPPLAASCTVLPLHPSKHPIPNKVFKMLKVNLLRRSTT